MPPTDSSPDLESRIDAAVERAVQKVRDELLTRVQAAEDRIRDLSQRTAAEPAAARPAAPPTPAPPTGVDELLESVGALDRARSQPEVLAALLEGAGRFAARSALFLTRPDGVQGWGSFGFEEIAEGLQELTLSYGEEGPWARLAEGRGCVRLDAAECEDVCQSLGAAPAAEGLLLPFVLRDRVAAALYVDRPAADDPLATESLQLLTHLAALSLEGLAARQRPETPTLHFAEDAAGGPGLAIWEAEEVGAEPAVAEEALAEEAEPVVVEEEIPELVAVEEELPEAEPLEAEEVAVEEAEEAVAVEEAEEPVAVEEAEEPVAVEEAEEEAPEFEEPVMPLVEETAAEPSAPPDMAPIAEIPVPEEALAESQEEPSVEPTPALDTMPMAELAEEEIEAPEPDLPPIPDLAPPAPPLAEPSAAEPAIAAVVEEPTRPLEPLVEPTGEPAAAVEEAATAPLAPEMAAAPAPTPPPPAPVSPPPPAEAGRETTEVRPPTDVEGPGWAFTAARTPADAGDEAQHEEARRLARLLVTEIKLYNEEQVEEGRRSNDIYARLKEDIDRSRQIFDERVDEGIREEFDYFQEEMVRILGGGKPETLGL